MKQDVLRIQESWTSLSLISLEGYSQQVYHADPGASELCVSDGYLPATRPPRGVYDTHVMASLL